MTTSCTTVLIRVIAVGGKFLGDDIGGAAISVQDVLTGALLDSGVQSGTSGPAGVMCTPITRQNKIPDDGQTASWIAHLNITEPTQVEIKAFGPLGARVSANTASVTTWVYPGQNIPPSTDTSNGIVLELPGLICQIIEPTTHDTTTYTGTSDVNIVANVAMMCGCPISDKSEALQNLICQPDQSCPSPTQPWLPGDFNVNAIITTSGAGPIQVQLTFDETDKNKPGRFIGTAKSLHVGGYKMKVWAQQSSTGNTGVDMSTFAVSKPPS